MMFLMVSWLRNKGNKDFSFRIPTVGANDKLGFSSDGKGDDVGIALEYGMDLKEENGGVGPPVSTLIPKLVSIR